MKIIITGATGFVGQNLRRHIEKQKLGTVQAVSLRNGIPPALEGDALIHLAGKAHDIANTSDSAEYFQVNAELTKQLFDRFLASGVRDFIFMSSVKAVSDTVDDVLCEDADPAPKTPYGQSKLQAEQYLLQQALPAGKRLFILRPCMIHGPGNKGNLNLLYQLVSKNIPYPLGAFDNRRSFLSVDNLCFVIESLLTRPEIESGVFQVADDEPLSTNELIRIIAHTAHKKPKIWKLPEQVIRVIAKAGDATGLPLNSERLKKLTENYVVSNRKLKETLHISTLPVAAKDGISQTIRSFVTNK